MKVITTEKHVVKMWIDNVEDGAMEQIRHLANLPFVFKHIAIMPDCHQGYGMPIGAVMATKNVIVPNAVGVDIGCGMCALRTSLTDIEKPVLKQIMSSVRSKIPVGFDHHKVPQDKKYMPNYDNDYISEHLFVVRQEFDSALYSLGTLGGCNHFIEIQKGDDGFIWIMIHSGSRNLGYRVAKHYNEIATELNKRYYSSVPSDWQLSFLPLDSSEANSYMKEMTYCVEFAKQNRNLMMRRIKESISENINDVEFDESIQVVHNYASIENHFNHNVVVHRKGATKAYEGQLGIIPGSQGTASYIVVGKGNPESFKSCSHGAGRKLGRKQARLRLDLEEQKKILDDAGVIHSIRHTKDLDEAPGAYKDIDSVIANQSDLVEVKVRLTPLAVIKG